jgi:hypothetical protein
LRHRANQLLIPSVIGIFLVVIPTEFMGRNWRTCAKGPDNPYQWLQHYLFHSSGLSGIQCEGLGWLGFMVSLFFLQALLRPWCVVLHQQTLALSGNGNKVFVIELLVPMLWFVGGISLSSFFSLATPSFPSAGSCIRRPRLRLLRHWQTSSLGTSLQGLVRLIRSGCPLSAAGWLAP